MTINLRKITQGERGTLTFTWEFPENLTSPASISGATITATMTDEDGVTTAVSGTLTGTAATVCTWALSAGDSGTAGTFTVVFKAVATGVTTYTLEATLEVITNPSVTGTQNDPLVSISAADAAWVTVGAAGGGLGDAAYEDTTAFDAAGTATTAQAAAIAALGGADGTATDEQLRNWAGQLPGLMTSVARTDYSQSWTGVDGSTKYAGFISITGTVTWPDGITGHVDGVEYPEKPGVLQYFTASHVTSGKIVVQPPLVDGAAGLTVITPDYYVDSAAVAGGDGSLAAPFDTISDLSLVAGNVVALKSGSNWKEAVAAGDDFHFYRYGSGDMPILDGSAIADNALFTKTAGLTNVYQIALSIPLIVDNCIRVWQDDVPLPYVASAALCDAAPGSYYTTAHSGNITLYVHATDSSDITTNSKVYEYPFRSIADFRLCSGCTFDGLELRRPLPSLALWTGENAIVRNIRAIGGGKHLIQINQNSKLYNVFTDDILQVTGVTTASTIYNIYENTPAAGSAVLLQDCAAMEGSIDSIVSPVNGHSAPGAVDFAEIKINRMYVGNNQAGSPVENGTLVSFDKCVFRSRPFALPTALFSAGTLDVSGCAFDTNTATAMQWVVSTFASANLSSFTVKDCYIAARAGTGSTGIIRHDVVNPLVFNRNVVKSFTSSYAVAVYSNKAGVNIKMLGNAFEGVWTAQLVLGNSYTGTLMSNKNTYTPAIAIYHLGTGYTTLATWQAILSQDLLSAVI